MRFWLKNCHFESLQSLLLRGEKVLTRKSLVLTSWVRGAKLAWQIPFRGAKMLKCMILALKRLFWHLSESPPVREENCDHPNLAWKVSSISLWGSGCKISINIPFKGIMTKYAILAQKLSFSPFQSLALREEKVLTFQIWLKKSLVLPSVYRCTKLAQQISFAKVKMTKYAILA